MSRGEEMEIFKEGLALPLVEIFYTLQGEGYNTGRAACFVRLGGCDVCCSWCDAKETWDPLRFPPVSVEEIVDRVKVFPSEYVVITGGEPLKYNLEKLCSMLRKEGKILLLETSGSRPFSGSFDWVCLSPKRRKAPLDVNYRYADELKVIIESEDDFEWAEYNAEKVSGKCRLYLQPEWSRSRDILPRVIEYVKDNPKWCISLQTHKFMNIP